MQSKRKKIPYNEVLAEMGCFIDCTCQSSDFSLCVCEQTCFCTELKKKLYYAVQQVVFENATKKLLAVFGELKYNDNTIFDCVEFIEKVREHEVSIKRIMMGHHDY